MVTTEHTPVIRTDRAGATRTTTVAVAGMTCASCERRVARALEALPGVASATASSVRGVATMKVTRAPRPADVEAALRKAGYSVGTTAWLNRDPSVWRTFAVAGVAVAAVGAVASATGLTEVSGRLTDPGAGGLLVVLALGLAAGVSTCMAMVGGIVLAISATAAARASSAAPAGVGAASRAGALRSNVTFQAGRIVGFAVLGAVLGAVGASVAMPAGLVVVVTAAVAAVMLLLGLRLTQLSPRLAGWTPRLPVSLSERLGLSEASPATTAAGTALAGAATFFLPCGFTQAVQLYALSTGSPRTAAVVMATFALGTAPGLLTLAGAPTLLTGPRRDVALRALGVVVIGFAVLNASAATRLAGIDLPTLPTGGSAAAATATSVSANVTVTPADQTIAATQDGSGYHPGETVIYAGLPTHWNMTSLNVYTCASTLLSRDLGISGRLKEGGNLIELPALKPGTYRYSCDMGMYTGRLVVIPQPGTSAG